MNHQVELRLRNFRKFIRTFNITVDLHRTLSAGVPDVVSSQSHQGLAFSYYSDLEDSSPAAFVMSLSHLPSPGSDSHALR